MKYLTIACLVCVSLQSSAQYMVIHETGGTQTKIALADIAKLTFDLSNEGVAATGLPMQVAKKLKVAFAKIFPNPFNPRVEYTLQSASTVRIMVFDMLGKTVRTVQHGIMQPGVHNVGWDLRNDRGEKVSNGPYVLSVLVGRETISRNLFIVQ